LNPAESVAIQNSRDIVAARQKGRTLALEIGFTPTEAILVATAISELSRNILLYARNGFIRLERVEKAGARGISIVAEDQGPGIQDLRRATTGGYSTSGGLGLGLPGVRRLMDEMEVRSEPDKGTIVTATKWLT
jgi:serine/threonine-protein kinase RsbT